MKGISKPQIATLFASASRATATSDPTDVQDNNQAVFQLDVTAQSGTGPTLDVVVQDAPTANGPWSTLYAFTQVTAATGNQVASPTRSPMPFIRAVGTVGGSATPKFTYTLIVVLFKAAGVAVSTVQSGAGSFSQITVTGPNGATQTFFVNTELVTLATGAAVTDTTGNLLPANSIIDSVMGIVTTLITTAVSWGLGDPTTASRFTATNAGAVALGTKLIGLAHMQGGISTDAAGPVQTAAAKVRITVNANPGAGAVRVTVMGRTFAAPTA